ncbi:MAG: DUF4091 domain-containing protein [Ruminococcaceae bacterium]|nr:DUF4091 domain-containing protein [Oscillospiraceae bacterium]
MRYTIVDSAEFTYPDQIVYPTSSKEAVMDAPRGSYASFQVLLECLKPDHVQENWLPEEIYNDPAVLEMAKRGFPRVGNIRIETDFPFAADWYTLVPVTVEGHPNMFPEVVPYEPHFPERIAPYRIYDCLRPFDGTLDVGVGDGRVPDTDIGGLYCAIRIPEDAEPGTYTSDVTISWGEEAVTFPITVNVYKAVVPEESLYVLLNYSFGNACRYHGIPFDDSAKKAELDDAYLKMMRHLRMNSLYVGGFKSEKIGENQYRFDFSELENKIRHYISLGFKHFMLPGLGGRVSWETSTIRIHGGLDAMSYEAYCYLAQYLPALREMLQKNGWLDKVMMSVCDEPNGANATEFRALAGLSRRFAPEIRLADALSFCDIHGALDILIPLNAQYDVYQKEFENLRSHGGDLWHYTSCSPRHDHVFQHYINRFMDYPLLSTRYLFWGNYKHNLTGYLHWAVNCYQTGQDPYVQNCPEHHNTDMVIHLPAGDTHLIYPGKDGPWLSIRGESQRESAEEYEMFKALSAVDKEKADAICNEVFRSFKDVEYDISLFRAARKKLLEALSEVQ